MRNGSTWKTPKKTKQSTHPVRVANEQLLRKREQKTFSLLQFIYSQMFVSLFYMFMIIGENIAYTPPTCWEKSRRWENSNVGIYGAARMKKRIAVLFNVLCLRFVWYGNQFHIRESGKLRANIWLVREIHQQHRWEDKANEKKSRSPLFFIYGVFFPLSWGVCKWNFSSEIEKWKFVALMSRILTEFKEPP